LFCSSRATFHLIILSQNIHKHLAQLVHVLIVQKKVKDFHPKMIINNSYLDDDVILEREIFEIILDFDVKFPIYVFLGS